MAQIYSFSAARAAHTSRKQPNTQPDIFDAILSAASARAESAADTKAMLHIINAKLDRLLNSKGRKNG